MNGKVVELAGRVGLRADTNRLLTHLIRARERMWRKRVRRWKLTSHKNQSLEHGSDRRAGRARVSLTNAAASSSATQAIEEVRPIANIQNAQACEGSAAFPRDARTAFLMDPKEHLAVMREIDDRKLALEIVYHSHPDHEAYFSPTDRRQACSFDPRVSGLSRDRLCRDVDHARANSIAPPRSYGTREKKEFVEVPLSSNA